MQCVDFTRAKPELLENLLVVFSQRRSASGRLLGDAVHLNGTADRRAQLAARTVKRNDNVVQAQLWILDNFLWTPHGAERDVNAIEDLVPMRHRPRSEDLVENFCQL